MNNGTEKSVVLAWSGGIDSTAVAACLLRRGYHLHLIHYSIYGGDFAEREGRARRTLLPYLHRTATLGGGRVAEYKEINGDWMWAFSVDQFEIPMRNKRIIDALVAQYCIPKGIKNLGTGAYLGADTAVVHLHEDTDHRYLSAYVQNEYGLTYRFFSLADFNDGKRPSKKDHLDLLVGAIADGAVAAAHTTVCLYNGTSQCGACTKCVERAAAFASLGLADTTLYLTQPTSHRLFPLFMQAMAGEHVDQLGRETLIVERMPQRNGEPKWFTAGK